MTPNPTKEQNMTINPQTIKLKGGISASPSEGACFAQFINFSNGWGFSDRVECMDRAINRLGIWLNDRAPSDEERSKLIPLGIRGLDTATDGLARWRAYKCADFACRVAVPYACRARGREDLALRCEALSEVMDTASAATARALMQEVRADAAYADAADAAYAADADADAAAAAAAAADAADAADAAAYARTEIWHKVYNLMDEITPKKDVSIPQEWVNTCLAAQMEIGTPEALVIV